MYTYTYILVYKIPCKLKDVFETRSDEHKTTGYLDVVADVRCYKLKSSNIYIYIHIYIYLFHRYLLCDGDHSVFHK